MPNIPKFDMAEYFRMLVQSSQSHLRRFVENFQ